jgi:hypothetical protein
LRLDALLTGCGDAFHGLASTPGAGCTKHLLRVCLRPFRVGDCGSFPPRPRKSSRAFHRPIKAAARPWWRSWARGDLASTEAKWGDTPPVGLVSRFRSADGQPAVREPAKILILCRCRVTVRSCNQSSEVGTCGVGVHHGIVVPQVAMSRGTLKKARPLMPQFGTGTDRTGRLGLGSGHGIPPCLLWLHPCWEKSR